MAERRGYGMHGHGVHRGRRPAGWWRRPAGCGALAGLFLVVCAVAGAAISDTYRPAPETRYTTPPGVVLVPEEPIPCAAQVRAGCDLVVRQMADARDGVTP